MEAETPRLFLSEAASALSKSSKRIGPFCHNDHVRFLFGAWVTLVAAGSLAPLRVKLLLGTSGRWHNPIHMVVFFLTGVMLFADARLKPSTRATRAVLLFLFCCTLEWLEAVLYHNGFEWGDMFLDTIAIACALSVVVLIAAIRKRSPRLLNG